MQGFDPRVITGGASGYLRQEFRELEILDEITRMRYEKLLPNHFTGNRRNSLIHQFQEWNGTNYVPKNVHNSIRWNKHDPLDSLNVVTDSPWQIIQRGKQKGNAFTNKPTNSIGFVTAKGSVPVTVTTSKRPLDVDDRTEVKAKRAKLSEETTITKDKGPSGPVRIDTRGEKPNRGIWWRLRRVEGDRVIHIFSPMETLEIDWILTQSCAPNLRI